MADSDERVLLMTCRDNVEVMGIRSVLASEGIDVFVQGEHHRALEGAAFAAIIELRVFVRRGDLEDARVLLEEIEYAEHLPAESIAADPKDRSLQRFVQEHPEPDFAPEAETSARLSPRRIWLAIVLAVIAPLGTAHIYARRTRTGIALAVLMLATLILALRGWTIWRGVVVLVAFDAFGAAFWIQRDRATKRLDSAPHQD